MPETFKDYSAAELKRVGKSFVESFRTQHRVLKEERIGTAQWTECCLDWFSNAAPKSVRVDAEASRGLQRGEKESKVLRDIAGNRRQTKGEFLFDLCHSTWLADDVNTTDYWSNALKLTPRLKLVLESEMGKQLSTVANIDAVVEDAVKLLHIACDTKVVIFASNRDSQKRMLSLASQLFGADKSTAAPAWLWLDLPWLDWDTLQPDGWLFHGPSAEPQSVM